MTRRTAEWRGPALAAAGGALFAVAANGLVFGLGLADTSGLTGAERGPINAVINRIVPFVWIGLYAAMGAAVWLLRTDAGRLSPSAILVLVLLVNCAAYGIYTDGFRSEDAGLAGNYGTALLAVLAAASAWPRSRMAALLVVPVAIWVSVALIGLYATQTGRTF